MFGESFFAICNANLSNSVHQSELLRLNLMVCVAAIKFTDTHLKALNACWNTAFRKIFGFHRWWESVKTFICGLGRLGFKHIYALRCFKFWKSVYISSNVVLRTVFSGFANSQDFNQLCCSYGVSVMGTNFSELTCVVYEHFRTNTMWFFFLLYCVHCCDVVVLVVVFVCLSVCLFVWIFIVFQSVFVTNKHTGWAKKLDCFQKFVTPVYVDRIAFNIPNCLVFYQE